MSNIRIIAKNLVDTASSIVASSTSGGLIAENMRNEYKGSVHRSIGTSVTYTITLPSATAVGGIALPAVNLSGSATIRARLYNGGLVADSGVINACPGSTLELWDWSQPLNANSFIYGGASKTAIWFDNQVAASSVVIDIVDTGNSAGYIDCAKIVVGNYWEPTYNISNGISVTITDLSSISRADSGDLIPGRDIIYDTLSFDFSILLEQDKNALIQLMRKVGSSRNILVSVFPDNNSLLEQENIIYGKRANSDISQQLYGMYNHSMNIEGW